MDAFFGSSVVRSIFLLVLCIAAGLFLGKFRVRGITIGSTWILFVGILLSHFGLCANRVILDFTKNFGLILFVFSIGLQVGPGFFHSFKRGGLPMNLLAAGMVLLAAVSAFAIHLLTGEDLLSMVGVMSGAVTNTPGLGAAQAMVDGGAGGRMASAYAVAYPFGVLGTIFAMMAFKALFRADIRKEAKVLEAAEAAEGGGARRMHCEVQNPAIFGETIAKVCGGNEGKIVVSRLMRDGEVSMPGADTALRQGDRLLIITTQADVELWRTVFGKEVPMHQADWMRLDGRAVVRKLLVSKSSVNGKRLRELDARAVFGVTVTRIHRAGVELVARPDLILQMGDSLQVVGPEKAISQFADMVGNQPTELRAPHLIPVFFGMALGILLGLVPIHIPGIPQPIRLGLAGGPLIVAILLGHFGPKWKITTYMTNSANLLMRDLGISLFLAAVGLGAGGNFVSSLMHGGYNWFFYGVAITLLPLLVVCPIARYVFKMDFFRISGLIAGATTNPPALAFAQGAYDQGRVSVNYATVYPLSMFLRVLAAQLLAVIALM